MISNVKLVVGTVLVYVGFWLMAYQNNINTLAIQSEDTLPSLFLPFAILKEKTLYLDTYYDMMVERYPDPTDRDHKKNLIPFYVKQIRVGETVHYISAFPLMSGFLVLPIYFLYGYLGLGITWEYLAILSHFGGAFIIGLSGVLFRNMLKKHFLAEDRLVNILTFVYLFGTINFSLISQALWQHGPVQLFLILALDSLLDQKDTRAGFYSGLALLRRPTAIIPIALLGLHLLFRGKQINMYKGVQYLAGIIPSILFFVWYTSKYYLGISNNGYSSQVFTEWLGKFPEGFLGLWLSPSKGILIYSPVLIFSLVGLYIVLKNKEYEFRQSYLVYASIILIHTIVLGQWKHWFGG